MKVKIRKGFFETNSSSIHAIVLPKGLINKYEIPSELNLHLIDDISDIFPITGLENRLNFMVTVLYVANSGYEIKYLINILNNCYIRVNIADDRIDKAMYDKVYEDLEIYDENSIEDLTVLMRKVLYNDKVLLKYLFGDTIIDYAWDSDIFEKYQSSIYEIII